jgi:hypothetical protein
VARAAVTANEDRISRLPYSVLAVRVKRGAQVAVDTYRVLQDVIAQEHRRDVAQAVITSFAVCLADFTPHSYHDEHRHRLRQPTVGLAHTLRAEADLACVVNTFKDTSAGFQVLQQLASLGVHSEVRITMQKERSKLILEIRSKRTHGLVEQLHPVVRAAIRIASLDRRRVVLIDGRTILLYNWFRNEVLKVIDDGALL